MTQEWWENVLDDEGRKRVEAKGRKMVLDVLKKLTPGLTLISGGAKGPDSWAADAAKKYHHSMVEILPNWKKYGKGAGFKRNKEIVDAANDVIAFWDLESNGTWHTIKQAAKAEKPFMIFGPDGQLFFYATTEDYEGEESLLDKMVKQKKLRDGIA